MRLGAVLAAVGGFLDAYTYVGRHGVFANSQTGNVVLFGVLGARGEWAAAFAHVPPILAFLLGVVIAETLKRPAVARIVRWPARAALVLEIVVLVVVGSAPASTPDWVVTVAVACVASIQVSTFRTVVQWTYNTTMVTGNLRAGAQATYLAIVDRDPAAAAQARVFGVVIGSFFLGGCLGGVLTFAAGPAAAWFAAFLLVFALGLFFVDEWPAGASARVD